MKTVLIVISFVCTDYIQGTYCYKSVVERTPEEISQMKTIDRVCDTFTIITSKPLKVGDRVPVEH